MKNNNPKYAFYYFLSLISLIFLAVSSALIIFEIIDRSVIDALSNNFTNQNTLRFGISAILISAPIFFLSVNLINKGLRRGEIEKDSSLRNWLTYFILFVSAVIILGSLIGIINSFLSGEITLKFVLQMITVVVISALVFSFYLYDIKREDVSGEDRTIKIFFISTLSLVLAIFISSWFFVESPKVARDRKADNQMMQNISIIESYVNDYYEENETLPENLENLDSVRYAESVEGVEYNRLGGKEFELCADFKTDSYESQRSINYYPGSSSRAYVKGWNCFEGNLWSEKNIK
jgi:hypothetical protein